MNDLVDGIEDTRRTMPSAEELGDRLINVVNLVKDQLAGTAREADDFVRNSPWKAVGVVALVALAAGVLIGRARSGASVRWTDRDLAEQEAMAEGSPS